MSVDRGDLLVVGCVQFTLEQSGLLGGGGGLEGRMRKPRNPSGRSEKVKNRAIPWERKACLPTQYSNIFQAAVSLPIHEVCISQKGIGFNPLNHSEWHVHICTTAMNIFFIFSENTAGFP